MLWLESQYCRRRTRERERERDIYSMMQEKLDSNDSGYFRYCYHILIAGRELIALFCLGREGVKKKEEKPKKSGEEATLIVVW